MNLPTYKCQVNVINDTINVINDTTVGESFKKSLAHLSCVCVFAELMLAYD